MRQAKQCHLFPEYNEKINGNKKKKKEEKEIIKKSLSGLVKQHMNDMRA